MCLDTRFDRSKIKALPKEFVAYKAVMKKQGKYYFPICQTSTAIEKENRLAAVDAWESVWAGGKYRPYYHCFRTMAAIREVERAQPGKWTFIKIRIEKKDVTAIGTVGRQIGKNYRAIVSKAFTTEFEEISPCGK